MDQQENSHTYMLNNILDGSVEIYSDDKQQIKRDIKYVRTNSIVSAPSLYNYSDFDKQITGYETQELDDICTKLEPPSPLKITKKHKSSFDFFDTLSLSPLTKTQKTKLEKIQKKQILQANEKVQSTQTASSMNTIGNGCPLLYPYPITYTPYIQVYSYSFHQQLHYLIMKALEHTKEMAKQRNNSKTLQYYFQNSSPQDRDLIFQEIIKDAIDLSADPFGNYVVQKILEVGSRFHKQKLFIALKGRISDLSTNSFGCRVIQKVIESLFDNLGAQKQLVQQIFPTINNLIVDQNANHVIQKIFQYFSVENTIYIAEKLCQNVRTLAFHIYGCRVLQKFIEKGNKSLFFNQTLEKLNEMMIPLCKCLYGNYVMQYLAVHGPLEQRNFILLTIKNNFIQLSLDKFASNVVQKSVINCNDNFRKEIFKILQTVHRQGSDIGLVVLAKGQYSNYVIQRYLECSTRQIQEGIMGMIKPGSENYEKIKDSNYGKHVLTQLEKYR